MRPDHQHQPPAGPQDPARLGDRGGLVLDVVEHRDEHHRVGALVGQRQPLRVALERLQALRGRLGEHRRLAVDHERVPALVAQRERVVAGAAADVHEPPAGRPGERLPQRPEDRRTGGARLVVRPRLVRVVAKQAHQWMVARLRRRLRGFVAPLTQICNGRA